jgi:O-antigen/teichoic acid export membrane protein
MAGRRPATLFAAAATTYGTNLAVAVLSLVNVLVIARALGASGRGAVAFLVAIAILSGHLGSFGVHEANANIAGVEPKLRPALAANSLLFALVLGAATAAAVAGLVAVAPSVGGGATPMLLLVSLASIPLVLGKQYLKLLVQADYGYGVTNVAWLAGPATSVVANSIASALGVISIGSAIGAWVAGQALGLTLLVVSVARGAGFGRPDLRVARRALGFGLKTHLGHFMDVGNYRADQWLLGAIAGTRELGLYSVAVAWAEVLFYLPGVLVLVQRPDLVRARAAQAARLAARVFRVTLVLAAGLALLLAAAAPLLCSIVFGSEFDGSVPELRVLALSAFGISALELLGNALTAQRKPMLEAGAIAVAFATTIVLDLVLIPPLGGLGAAIATSVAYSAGGAAIAAIFVRSLGARASDLVPRGSDLTWLARKVRTGVAQVAFSRGVS